MFSFFKSFFRKSRGLRPGDVILGQARYELLEELGRGGQGQVFLAKVLGAAGFEKTAAVKVMRLAGETCQKRKDVQSFVNEAKLAAMMTHENIIQIFQLDHTSQGYFYVLEYVDGITLHDLLEDHRRAGKPLPYPLAVFITSQIARGLAYAHNLTDKEGRPLHIVHRDICIRNIMINCEGVPKLMDFGLAKTVRSREEGNFAVGKWGFMPPEQLVDSAKVDFRGDIYSLGIVFFHLLSGKSPRNSQWTDEERFQFIQTNRLDWGLLPPDVPDKYREILHKMLETNPDDRYANTRDLLTALEEAIYSDGYGPTIVKLSDYLTTFLPGRFQKRGPAKEEEKLDATQTAKL